MRRCFQSFELMSLYTSVDRSDWETHRWTDLNIRCSLFVVWLSVVSIKLRLKHCFWEDVYVKLMHAHFVYCTMHFRWFAGFFFSFFLRFFTQELLCMFCEGFFFPPNRMRSICFRLVYFSFIQTVDCCMCGARIIEYKTDTLTTKAGNNNNRARRRRRRNKKKPDNFYPFSCTLDAYELVESALCENFSYVHVPVQCTCNNPIQPTTVSSNCEQRMNEQILLIGHCENHINSIKYPYCFWSIKCEGKFMRRRNRSIRTEDLVLHVDRELRVGLPVILNCRFSRIRGLTRTARVLALGLLVAIAAAAVAVEHVDFMQLLFVVDFSLQLVSQMMGHDATVERSTMGNLKTEKSMEWSAIDRWIAKWLLCVTYHVVWIRLLNHHYC